MARDSKATDFLITVEGVGKFTFGRRTWRDELAIQREYADILNGVIPTTWLNTLANWTSVIKTLLVRAPDGWDLDNIDPLEDETYQQIGRVFDALLEKENSFRRNHGAPGQAGSAGAPPVDPVPVSPQVPAD